MEFCRQPVTLEEDPEPQMRPQLWLIPRLQPGETQSRRPRCMLGFSLENVAESYLCSTSCICDGLAAADFHLCLPNRAGTVVSQFGECQSNLHSMDNPQGQPRSSEPQQVRKLRLGRESVAKSQTATPGRVLRPVQRDRGMKKILASPQ
ncbi:uncharacterized protein AAG666_001043 isoform 1-T3 [Megaptera novaeangliae]